MTWTGSDATEPGRPARESGRKGHSGLCNTLTLASQRKISKSARCKFICLQDPLELQAKWSSQKKWGAFHRVPRNRSREWAQGYRLPNFHPKNHPQRFPKTQGIPPQISSISYPWMMNAGQAPFNIDLEILDVLGGSVCFAVGFVIYFCFVNNNNKNQKPRLKLPKCPFSHIGNVICKCNRLNNLLGTNWKNRSFLPMFLEPKT